MHLCGWWKAEAVLVLPLDNRITAPLGRDSAPGPPPGEGLSTWPAHDTPRSDRTWPRGDLGLHGIPWATQRWAPAAKDLCTPVHPREKPSHQRSFRTPHVSASLLRGTLNSSLISHCTKHAMSNTVLPLKNCIVLGRQEGW